MLAAAAALLVATGVVAHLEPLGARAPFLAAGQLVGGSTSWGVVVIDDDGAARRVCEEATGVPAVQHLPLDGGRVLAVAGGQVLRSDDDGCSWQGTAAPPGAEVHAVARAGERVWAAAGRAGHPSGLLVSTDGGARFEATRFWSGPSPLFEIAAALVDGAPVAWATGDDIDTEAPQLVVAHGAPGDAVVVAADLSAFTSARVVGVDHDGSPTGRALIVGLLSTGASTLLSVGAAGDVVTLGEVPLPATHIVPVGGPATDPATPLYAVVTPGQLWRREGGRFVAVGDVRARCAVADGEALWLCGHTSGALAGVHFARTLDGTAFEVLLRDDEITERRCPADTVGGAVCARYLDEEPPPPGEPDEPPPTTPGDPAAADVPPAADPVAPEVETPPGGGCGAVAGGPLCLVLLALRRRPRRWA